MRGAVGRPTGVPATERRDSLRRNGYTLAQVAIAGVVLATALHLALPHIHRWRAEADAREARDRVERLGEAARTHLEREGSWPSDADPGAPPPELAEVLAELSFRGEGYELDWEAFPVPDGLPSARGVQSLGGVVVRSDDAAVLEALRGHAWSADGWLVGADRVIRVLVPPE